MGTGQVDGLWGFRDLHGTPPELVAPPLLVEPIDILYITPPYTPPMEYPPVTTPIAQVPETSTWAMLALGFAFLFGLGRKHASNKRVIDSD